MIVVGNRPTQDHFSKVSIYNFSGLKKRVYRNDRKNLPWHFWEVSWVGLFPTTIYVYYIKAELELDLENVNDKIIHWQNFFMGN